MGYGASCFGKFVVLMISFRCRACHWSSSHNLGSVLFSLVRDFVWLLLAYFLWDYN